MKNIADRLNEKITKLKSPIVVGSKIIRDTRLL